MFLQKFGRHFFNAKLVFLKVVDKYDESPFLDGEMDVWVEPGRFLKIKDKC
jgi:hypothetical protein